MEQHLHVFLSLRFSSVRLRKKEEGVTLLSHLYDYYGNMGSQVVKWGVQNQKDFCLRINIPKENYFENW